MPLRVGEFASTLGDEADAVLLDRGLFALGAKLLDGERQYLLSGLEGLGVGAGAIEGLRDLLQALQLGRWLGRLC